MADDLRLGTQGNACEASDHYRALAERYTELMASEGDANVRRILEAAAKSCSRAADNVARPRAARVLPHRAPIAVPRRWKLEKLRLG
jgi:hypothetical protein